MKKALIIAVIATVLIGGGITLFWRTFYYERQPVRVTEVRRLDLHATVNTNGTIEAERVFEIRSSVSGACRRILVREGMMLKRDQPILEIDSEASRSELAAATAELAAAELDLRNIRRGPTAEELNQAEAELTRARMEAEHARNTLQTNEWLLPRGAISKYEVELSRHEMSRAQQSLEAAGKRRDDIKIRFGESDSKRAESRIAAAQSRIRYLEALIAQSVLRAPADGILYQFDLKDGAYIQAADQLGYLADLTKLRLKAYVDEPDLGKITPGAEVIITWNAHPEKRWKAKVSYIPFHVAAHGTRSVGDVYCPIDDPGPALIPNIHVDVEISMAQVLHVAALPRNTVFSEGKSHYVWAPRGEQARKVAVQVGRSTPALMEITKGLLLGDKVIVPEDVPITEGMKIRIVEDKAANERS